MARTSPFRSQIIISVLSLQVAINLKQRKSVHLILFKNLSSVIECNILSQQIPYLLSKGNLYRTFYLFIFIFWGDFFYFFVLYSTLLHLPPLRFHCADGCWDRTQDRCNWCITEPIGNFLSLYLQRNPLYVFPTAKSFKIFVQLGKNLWPSIKVLQNLSRRYRNFLP